MHPSGINDKGFEMTIRNRRVNYSRLNCNKNRHVTRVAPIQNLINDYKWAYP